MRTANEILLEKRALLEEKDPKEESIILAKAIGEFLKKEGGPSSDLATSIGQAHKAMKLYNLVLTLARKMKGDPTTEKMVSLAERDLPKYWEGKIEYSRNVQFTPVQRKSL